MTDKFFIDLDASTPITGSTTGPHGQPRPNLVFGTVVPSTAISPGRPLRAVQPPPAAAPVALATSKGPTPSGPKRLQRLSARARAVLRGRPGLGLLGGP